MNKSIVSLGLAIVLWWPQGLARAADHAASTVTPDEAIHRLQEGNARYAHGTPTHPREGAERRSETAAGGQHPFVTVLACSDSRVPLEILFDQGVGDIFVIRVAGNVCGPSELGSIEYGVDHTATPLLVVLGHTQCGAVTAAATEADVQGNIKPLVERIAPAVARAQAAHPDLHGQDLVPAAVESNVWLAVEDLFKKSPATRRRAQSGKVKVIGAIYDIKSGQVRWLGEHPKQAQLLGARE